MQNHDREECTELQTYRNVQSQNRNPKWVSRLDNTIGIRNRHRKIQTQETLKCLMRVVPRYESESKKK